MKRIPAFAVLAVAIGFVLAGFEFAHAQFKSDSKVKMTVKASPVVNGKQTLDIQLKIEDDWHIYANPVGLALDNNKTTVRFSGLDQDKYSVEYPKGVEKVDGKLSYWIYKDVVTIKAQVERDGAPLKLRVLVNACGDVTMTCLPQGILEAKVE